MIDDGIELYRFKSLTSTQDVIKQILMYRELEDRDLDCSYKEKILVVLADQQTSGRGRFPDRVWSSPVGGNLYTTLGIKYIWNVDQIRHFPFLVSCSLLDTIKSFLPDDKAGSLVAKWPNDLLLEGKKLCGILIDMWKNKNQSWLLIGIGLNIVSSPGYASKLSDYVGYKIDIIDLLNLLIVSLRNEIARYNEFGFTLVRKKWLDFAWKLSEPISIADGEFSLSGRFIDIDSDGALVLQDSNGVDSRIFCGNII